jgi:hypothetical protein
MYYFSPPEEYLLYYYYVVVGPSISAIRIGTCYLKRNLFSNLYPVSRIRIHFIRIRIQHLRRNNDPDLIRIQGFADQKLEKICSWNFFFFFDQKLLFTYPKTSIKDVRATKETLSTQKRISSTSKPEFLNFFLFLWVIFALLQNPDPDGSTLCIRRYFFDSVGFLLGETSGRAQPSEGGGAGRQHQLPLQPGRDTRIAHRRIRAVLRNRNRRNRNFLP